MKKWRCIICGYIHEGDQPPYKCPICGAPKQMFEEIGSPPEP
jgi:rubrerythrin